MLFIRTCSFVYDHYAEAEEILYWRAAIRVILSQILRCESRRSIETVLLLHAAPHQ